MNVPGFESWQGQDILHFRQDPYWLGGGIHLTSFSMGTGVLSQRYIYLLILKGNIKNESHFKMFSGTDTTVT
jgi:hypothetical protein